MSNIGSLTAVLSTLKFVHRISPVEIDSFLSYWKHMGQLLWSNVWFDFDLGGGARTSDMLFDIFFEGTRLLAHAWGVEQLYIERDFVFFHKTVAVDEQINYYTFNII